MDWRDIEFFGEENFIEKMAELKPWLEHEVQDGYFHTTDGVKLHYCYAIPKDVTPKGTIVMVHGFCEFFGKYHEVAHYFYEAGYAFFFLEQRGHGLSDRMTDNPCKVFVNSYEEYVQDLREFLKVVVKVKKPKGPQFLFSHSMGGMVSMLFLEKYPNAFAGAVLSSPMLAVKTGKLPDILVPVLKAIALLLNWREKYCIGQHDFDPTPHPERSSASSIPRYQYQFAMRQEHPEYQTSGATYSWIIAGLHAGKVVLRHAGLLQTPVLMLRAGCDTMVDMRGQEHFLQRRPDVRVSEFPDAKHEIFNSNEQNRRRFYKEVFTFYEEILVKSRA